MVNETAGNEISKHLYGVFPLYYRYYSSRLRELILTFPHLII